jgi:hypothetical protein
MSDDYLDWTALLDEQSKPSSGDAQTLKQDAKQDTFDGLSAAQEASRDLRELLQRDDVSAQVKGLVQEHIELKQKLDALTGKASESKSPTWNEQRFGFPQHTAQSRIKDRKRLRYEEQARMHEKRRLEHHRLDEKLNIKVEQLKADKLRNLAAKRALDKLKQEQNEIIQQRLKTENLLKRKQRQQATHKHAELRQQQRISALMQQRNKQKAVFENIQKRSSLIAQTKLELEQQNARDALLKQQAEQALKQVKTKKQESNREETLAREKRQAMINSKRIKQRAEKAQMQQALEKKEAMQQAMLEQKKQLQAEEARQARLKSAALQRRREKLAEFDK